MPGCDKYNERRNAEETKDAELDTECPLGDVQDFPIVSSEADPATDKRGHVQDFPIVSSEADPATDNDTQDSLPASILTAEEDVDTNSSSALVATQTLRTHREHLEVFRDFITDEVKL